MFMYLKESQCIVNDNKGVGGLLCSIIEYTLTVSAEYRLDPFQEKLMGVKPTPQ